MKTSSRTNQSRRMAQQQKRRNTRILRTAAMAAGIMILVVAVLLLTNRQPAAAQIDGVQEFTNLSREHTTDPVTYDQVPPVGGMHSAEWLNCGVYTQPVKNENAVHSLEHGAVWITYQPDLPADQLQKLQGLTRKSAFRLLSPYPGIPSPIVLSAWGVQLKVDTAGDPRINKFIKKYEDNGPEPGATCSGGVGTPEP